MDYRYTITDRLGITVLNPAGEDITVEYEMADEKKSGYTKNIPDRLVFTGAAFRHFEILETSIYKCEPIYLSIDKKCVTGAVLNWNNEYTGRMSLINGDWDFDRCRLEIKMDEVKPDQCLDDNADVEFNLLGSLAVRHNARTLPSNIQFEFVTYTLSTSSGPPCNQSPYWAGTGEPEDGGWVPYEDSLDISGPTSPGVYTCHKTTKWVRQFIEIDCADPDPGSDWILIDETVGPPCIKKYVRPAALYDCVTDRYPSPSITGGVPYNNYDMVCKVLGYGENATVIDNGILLSDLLPYAVNLFCPELIVKSEFFQINPDIPSDINYVTGERNKAKNLIWFQKSDVKRPNTVENATLGKITFEKLTDALVELYNTEWRVEDGFFKIEHVDFWQKGVGIDLMHPQYAERLKFKNKYKYQTETIPSKETYQLMEASNGDFTGVPIVYTGGCVTKTAKDNIKKHVVDYVTTDVALCLSNPESDSKVVSDDGFVIIATYPDIAGEYYIITEAPILSLTSELNNSLAWAQLHRDYHMYKRQLRTGTLNDEPVTFLSVVPKKLGDKITIPLCCDQVFNPDDTMTGPFGEGVVNKATRNLKNNTLEVELLYPMEADLVTNAAPVAAGISLSMVKNTFTDISILPNVTDADAGATIIDLIIPEAPLHGTAIVIAGFKIRYTPDVDYVGDDVFSYRVKDNFSEPSNDGPIVIVVTN